MNLVNLPDDWNGNGALSRRQRQGSAFTWFSERLEDRPVPGLAYRCRHFSPAYFQTRNRDPDLLEYPHPRCTSAVCSRNRDLEKHLPIGNYKPATPAYGFIKTEKMSANQSGIFGLAAVIALFAIVPLRHAIFNSSGSATAIMIVIMATIGVSLGFIYEWKSAWCSGLCPIHPVEKLYGENVLFTVPNVQCRSCQNCVAPCPDSTPNVHPSISDKTIFHKISGFLITGGLPGFIWGWFHVPDGSGMATPTEIWTIYQLPLFGLSISLSIYAMMLSMLPKEQRKYVVRIFAAMSVSCYYWYRIPALLGFGSYADDGLLINLSHTVPPWSITLLQVSAMVFFFYWLVFRKLNRQSWAIRPEFAKR